MTYGYLTGGGILQGHSLLCPSGRNESRAQEAVPLRSRMKAI